MKRIKAPILAGITDRAIKHKNASVHIPAECYSNGVPGLTGLVHYNGTRCHLNNFHGFRAVSAVLETKGPPIEL
jgi:hypothetical protein